MKFEWKKHAKEIYLPKTQPETVVVPSYKYFALQGTGNPNDEPFSEAVGVLYSLSYGVKMLPKKGPTPEGYVDYAVFPLEGLWSMESGAEGFDKNRLEYKIMIRQPDFTTPELAAQVLDSVKKKKPHPLLEKVEFEEIEDGLSVQILHLGSYDSEPESFARMDAFCAEKGYKRTSDCHREIYLTDARKTAPEKLKTVLRYSVELVKP